MEGTSLGYGEKKLVAVRIIDLDGIVPPPGRLVGNRAHGKLALERCQAIRRQLDEQTRPVATRSVLAENDLAVTTADLADRASAIARMPIFLKPELVDIERQRPAQTGDK